MLLRIRRWTPLWLLTACSAVVAGLFPLAPSPIARSLLLGGSAVVFWTLGALGSLLRAREEPEDAAAWRAMALAFATAGLFSSIALGAQLTGGSQAPPPVAAVLITWVSILMLILAWIRFHPGVFRSRHRLGLLLDGGSFLAAFLLAYWLLFLRNLFLGGPFPLLDRVVTFGLVLGIVSTAGLYGRAASEYVHSLRSPVGYIGLALLLMALNLPFLRAVLERMRFLGDSSQLGMLPVWLLFVAATRRPFPPMRTASGRGELQPRDLFPYAPLLLALPVLAWTAGFRGRNLDAFALALLLILLACLAARQLLALHQVREINRTLEERVEARTRELSEAQACLVRTERMNVLATLGAGVAHDINNLLAAAKASADLVLEETADLPEPARRDLERLHISLDKAGQLTRRMLAFGRESTGPLSFCALDRLEALGPVLRALVPRRIELDVQRDAGHFPLLGDPHAFDQVVVNLVGNARDAIAGPGRIRIHAGREDGELRLEVADSGCGIPEEIRGRIFDPFFSTKPVGQGTGLGLSSLRVIVEGFGGRIEVDSSVGEGSTFRVLVPPGPERN